MAAPRARRVELGWQTRVPPAFGFAVSVAFHLYFTGGITGRVGSLITSGVLFLFGFQLIMIGLLADMIQTHTKCS